MVLTRIFGITTLLLLAVAPTTARAQVSRVGDTFNLWTAPTRGSAIAYDPKSDVYLAVSAQGTLRGRFVSGDGVPLGTPFAIQAPGGSFAHFPRVAYSPDADGGAGGFLVTWHESDQSPTSVHCRMLSYSRGIVSNDLRIPGSASFWEVGAAVTYATGSREFLIVWRSFAPADIMAVRISNAGGLLSGIVPISTAGAHEDNPNVAYNPQNDEFFVVHTSFTSHSTLFGQRVKAGTGQLLGAPATIAQGAGIYITDASYDPFTGLYLSTWYQDPPKALYGRLLHPDGSAAGDVGALSSRYRAYDALSVAHNRVSGTFFAVSHDSITSEDGGVEIDGRAIPLTAGMPVTAAGGLGNFYPRIAAHGSRAEWVVTTSWSFSATLGQRLQTASRSGGPAPPPPPAPTPAPAPAPTPPPVLVTNPQMAVDLPRANTSMVGNNVVVAGWAIDYGSPLGTGVDAIHVWGFPTSGAAPIFVGEAPLGISRPDVGAAYGHSRFSAGGFVLAGALPAGTYDLQVFAHSSITGTFNNARAVRITVTPPPTIPRMAVDLPGQNQSITRANFRIAGWALDLGAASGTGVDAVHVWAYPLAGGAPILVGGAVVGDLRPDVGAAFGSSRFSAAGFHLDLVGQIPTGEYNFVVYARSTVANAFNNVAVIRVRVL